MSEEAWGFDPPPFDAALARQQLRRALRELGLTERGPAHLLQGRPVVEISPPGGETTGSLPSSGAAVGVRLARRPAVTPQWEARSLTSNSQVRQFTEELRRRLASWRDED